MELTLYGCVYDILLVFCIRFVRVPILYFIDWFTNLRAWDIYSIQYFRFWEFWCTNDWIYIFSDIHIESSFNSTCCDIASIYHIMPPSHQSRRFIFIIICHNIILPIMSFQKTLYWAPENINNQTYFWGTF